MYQNIWFYHILFPSFRQEKKRRLSPPPDPLLLSEGLAVRALVHGGIGLMGTNQDLVQRAVILPLTVMGTLLDGTLDTLVCIAVHNEILL